VASLSSVVATYNNQLSLAVELAEEDGIQYAPPKGQYPVHDGPDHHPHHPKEVNGTIYEFLSNSPKFTLVTKALKFEENIAALLNDSSSKLTFFAPPDAVLRRKHRRHRPPHLQSSALWDAMTADPLSILEHVDLGSSIDLMDNVDLSDDGTDPEKRKKIIKFILHVVLSYHLLDSEYDIEKLAANNTLPSHLKFHHLFEQQPIRLRVSKTLIPPITSINFFSKIFFANISATNGFVHVVSHPIIPPPPVFQELYLVPEHFSILTSALQRSNLTDLVDFQYVHHAQSNGFEGSTFVTIFAPLNCAFEKLPRRLKLFLFSPFGRRVLQKLLLFHIVPEVAFFSDHIHHRKVEEQPDFIDLEMPSEGIKSPARRWFFNLDWPRRRTGPVVEPISREKYTLETALFNHTLDVVVDKKRITLPLPLHKSSAIKTHVIVNRQVAHVRDIVGLNGAIHVVDKLLDPRKHRHHPPKHEDVDDDEDWEDWEEWLPQWADEN
jgi:uncharacterized surface protein with fasciclin (FAS1) repeats